MLFIFPLGFFRVFLFWGVVLRFSIFFLGFLRVFSSGFSKVFEGFLCVFVGVGLKQCLSMLPAKGRNQQTASNLPKTQATTRP